MPGAVNRRHPAGKQKSAGDLQHIWACRQCSDISVIKKKYLCALLYPSSLNKPWWCCDKQAAQSLLLCSFPWQE